ncbi:protein FAM90A20 [Patagioenas fasciata]|uniref:protein FAM90A20 n=1 Tax=Patagioenas fasciata TaxID=372321 RepID=UPI003A9A49E4
MASWSPRRTRSPGTGAGFTAYYVKQNVTSSLSARPGSTLKAADNRRLASRRARPRPAGPSRAAALPPPHRPLLARRGGGGAAAAGAGRGGGPRHSACPRPRGVPVPSGRSRATEGSVTLHARGRDDRTAAPAVQNNNKQQQ